MRSARRGVRPAVIAIAIAAAIAAGLFARQRARARRSPALVVRAAHAGEASPTQEDADDDRAMALALASTPPAERQRLLELMNYTTARLEARLSPLGTDFGDEGGDPVVEFRRAMAAHMPQFNAARAFERGTWRSAELAIRVAADCDAAAPAEGETCISLWDTSDGPAPMSARARFLAWAVTRTAVVDLGTHEAADACAARLRDAANVPGAAAAVVLTDADLALRPLPDRSELQEAARRLGRAMAANDVEDNQHLEAFARAAPQGRVAPWLHVTASTLVVVPRLSAIANEGALAREIESAAAGAPLRWVHRP